jgi:lytic murein transglycosylase
MRTGRRQAILGLAAVALTAGCGGAGGGGSVPATRGTDPAFLPQPNPGWDAWVAGFRPRAVSKGVSPEVFDRAFRDAGFLPGVVERDRNQTEFTRSLEDYLAIAASDERVETGRAKLRAHGGTLAAIEARHGVDRRIVTAVWGLESNYGTRRGDIPVISALSTLAYDGRRGPFFESQLVAALKILQRGDTTPERMVGSWAGAMGHTQFIPTSYEAYAVDFTGDGRRDIWAEDPSDALASTAAYLARSGWRKGQPWVEEAGPGAPAGGSRLQPQAGGPVFLVYPNFGVIKRYNNSESYAIGVGYLANRIGGAGPLRAGFGPDANGLTIEDRKEIQRRLTAAGFDTGGTDGVIGRNTEAAIRAWERSKGQPETGRPSRELLAALR